jgi:hypothetical protein
LTLEAVHVCAPHQAQPALLHSLGTQLHAHAPVLYPVLIVLAPTTSTLAAVHAYALLRAQPALLLTFGILLHVHVYARYLAQAAFFHSNLTVPAVHVFVLLLLVNASLLINILMRLVVLVYQIILAL